MLINASKQTIETVEEAYAWIGNNLGPDADDSFVVTMLTVKVSPSLPFDSFPVCTWSCACPALHVTTTNSCIHNKTLTSPAD
jgi:hypothetical protein